MLAVIYASFSLHKLDRILGGYFKPLGLPPTLCYI